MSTCVNRVGFRRKGEGGCTEFIILPESFRVEVCKGFSERRAARVLAEAGWLKLSQVGRLKCERRLPDLGKVRAYIVVLPENDGRNSRFCLSRMTGDNGDSGDKSIMPRHFLSPI